MKIKELISEDYNVDLNSDLSNILINYKGMNIPEVKIDKIVRQLVSMGYSVDRNSIIDLLSNNPAVSNITSDSVKFTEPEGSELSSASTADSAGKVSAMAQKATKIS